jgi:UDP-2,3-diacylglucosamine pyrophosphatase LpxH
MNTRARSIFRLLTSAGLLLSLLFGGSGCQAPGHSIPFVTVREANLRHGPIDLPLSETDREEILSFLQRGGNWGNRDVTDFHAPRHYSGLLDLLSNPEFLYSHNFRNKNQIDMISPRMRRWFHDPIIYQIIDASRERPPVHNPMSISDGKYWWIFYTQKDSPDAHDAQLVSLTITASLSKSMRHYENIQESAAASPERHLDESMPAEAYSTRPGTPGEHKDLHSAFVEHLLQAAHVQLISRLKDARLGFSHPGDIRIFIPDIHLLSRDRAAAFKYGTNFIPLLSSLANELVEFKQATAAQGARVTVYQLGDFFDVWRETPVYLSKDKFAEGTATFVQKMAEDHQHLYETLFGRELNTHFVLGNHDFDLHYLEDFIAAELRYYFPFRYQTEPVAIALHGAVFDKREREFSDAVKHAAVHYLGPSVNQRVIDLTPARDLIVKDHGNKDYSDYIRHPTPPELGESLPLKDENLLVHDILGEDNFNVFSSDDSDLPEQDLVFFPQAKDFATVVNRETRWDIHLVICGHTHHPRIVIEEGDPDKVGFRSGLFALVDCGAWIEECNISGEIHPNAQIAILYNNEIRIYQLLPRE